MFVSAFHYRLRGDKILLGVPNASLIGPGIYFIMFTSLNIIKSRLRRDAKFWR